MSNIPLISRLSSRVIRILGCNPSPMTLQVSAISDRGQVKMADNCNNFLPPLRHYSLAKTKPFTSILILTMSDMFLEPAIHFIIMQSHIKALFSSTKIRPRLLIDAGDQDVPDYIKALENVLKEENVEIDKIIVTHWHHDHIGGVPGVIKLNGPCEVVKLKRDDIPDEESPDNIKIKFLSNNDKIKTDGATLTVHHTPGHTADHIVLSLAEENSLFSGDCILGQGTAVFEDLHNYMKSLFLILNLEPSVIYPGHGPLLTDPIPSIKHYIEHRQNREMEILNVLKSDLNKSFTEMDLVKIIYVDTPDNLHLAAANNVWHHLRKLEKDGQVTQTEDKWSYNKKSSL